MKPKQKEQINVQTILDNPVASTQKALHIPKATGQWFHRDLKRKVPAGFTADGDASECLLEEYLAYNGRIVTSHDYNEVI